MKRADASLEFNGSSGMPTRGALTIRDLVKIYDPEGVNIVGAVIRAFNCIPIGPILGDCLRCVTRDWQCLSRRRRIADQRKTCCAEDGPLAQAIGNNLGR